MKNVARVAAMPWMAVLWMALPRTVAWFWTDNLYGDAVVRTQLAQAWSHSPHLIRSFMDGALQFGPLHVMSMGALMAWVPEPVIAGKLLSFLAGCLCAVPLWRLTHALFDRRAAWVACAGLSVWGLHIQASTTAASEALGLFLLLSGLSSFVQEKGSIRRAAATGVWFTLACAVRYDAWLMGALLLGLRLATVVDRRGRVAAALGVGGAPSSEGAVAGVQRCLVFAAALALFPLLWMVGNAVDMGDPLYPIHFVDQYHQAWVARELGWYRQSFGAQGPVVFRAVSAVFWPGAAVLSLSPGIAVFAFLGLASKEARSARWLAVLVVVPWLYFTWRAAVVMNFVPLARFAMPQLMLLLPFVDVGIRWTVARWKGSVSVTGLAPAALVLAGVWSFALSWGTTHLEQPSWARALRPLSAVTPQPPLLQKLHAAVLALSSGSVLLDAAPEYQDIQLGSQPLPSPRQWRLLRQQREMAAMGVGDLPDTIVVFAGGVLGTHPALAWTSEGLTFKTFHFREVSGLPAGARLFVRSRESATAISQ